MELDPNRNPSIRVGLGWEKHPVLEIAGMGRDVDGDVFRLDNGVIWGREKGGMFCGVPLDGAISVVDDVGCDPDGVCLELRSRRQKRQNGN